MIIHRELPSGPIARAYTDLGNPFLTVAEAAAIVIVRALLVAITAKDRDTGLHSRRVARLTVLIAETLGLSQLRCDMLYLMALIHDIGKLAIDSWVLQKPSDLSPEEYAHIQTHVAVGVGILADLGLDHLIPGVSTHHERLDGCGYPRALRDGEIPLEGKVLAVADSVDAMSFSRIYRKTPRPGAEVDAILRDGVGGQWDATVVEAFLTRRADVDRLQREPLE